MRPRKARRLLALMAFGAILSGTGLGWAIDARADITDGTRAACEATRPTWSPCPERSHPRDPSLYGPIGNSAVGGMIR